MQTNDGRRRQRVVGVDVSRVLGGLLRGVHFLFAVGVVQGTYHDGLSDRDVFGSCQVCLWRLSAPDCYTASVGLMCTLTTIKYSILYNDPVVVNPVTVYMGNAGLPRGTMPSASRRSFAG